MLIKDIKVENKATAKSNHNTSVQSFYKKDWACLKAIFKPVTNTYSLPAHPLAAIQSFHLTIES